MIVSIIEQCLCDYLYLLKNRVNALVEQFITRLPPYIKDRLAYSTCES